MPAKFPEVRAYKLKIFIIITVLFICISLHGENLDNILNDRISVGSGIHLTNPPSFPLLYLKGFFGDNWGLDWQYSINNYNYLTDNIDTNNDATKIYSESIFSLGLGFSSNNNFIYCYGALVGASFRLSSFEYINFGRTYNLETSFAWIPHIYSNINIGLRINDYYGVSTGLHARFSFQRFLGPVIDFEIHLGLDYLIGWLEKHKNDAYYHPFKQHGQIASLVGVTTLGAGVIFNYIAIANYGETLFAYNKYRASASDIDNNWEIYSKNKDTTLFFETTRDIFYISSIISFSTSVVLLTFKNKKSKSANVNFSGNRIGISYDF